MTEAATGTSGCGTVTSGAKARLAWAMAAIFLAVLALITMGNAESQISEFAAAGVSETAAHVWIWQVTSIVGWLCVAPIVWIAVARVRPPRFGWAMAGALFVAGVFAASGLHIAIMIVLRKAIYALAGDPPYHFQGGLAHPYVYEFRKDVGTYLQFVVLAAACQWLLARVAVATPSPADEPEAAPFLSVSDGAVTHRVPIEEVSQIAAAGNYVEIVRGERALLHRTTLAAIEAELGERFVRIHRSRLVNRAFIRRIETNQSGDFDVMLADGTRAKGSRRYRPEVERRL